MVQLLAFSLQDQVEKYGAYIGIGAFFGLAVLSILYFAQARELRRLRDWAGRAPERAQEMEARVVAQAEAARRGAAPVRPAPATAAGAAGGAAASAEPATEVTDAPEHATAGNGTTDAAAGAPEEAEPVQGGNGGPPGEKTAAVAAGAAAAAKAGDDDEEPETGPADAAPGDAEAPAVGEAADADPAAAAAAGAESASDDVPPAAPGDAPPAAGAEPAAAPGDAPPAAPDDASPAAGEDAAPASDADPDAGDEAAAPGQIPVAPIPRATPLPRRAPVPAAPLRQPSRSATLPPRRPAPQRRSPVTAAASNPRGGRGLLVGGILGLVALVVVVLLVTGVFGGGSDTPPVAPNTTATPTAGGTPAASAALTPGTTKVAVLNGTTIPGLASTEKDKLTDPGFQGHFSDRNMTTGNNTDQQQAVSQVLYGTRSGARTQARAIARRLDIATIQRLDADTRDLSGNADVVVVVGQDKAP